MNATPTGHGAPVSDKSGRTTPCVVVGVSTSAAPAYDGQADELVDRLTTRLRERHAAVDWEVRRVRDPGAVRPRRSASVSALMARGRVALLAEDLDVVLVLSDVVPDLRGRPVAAHVSPVQQVAVLHVESAPDLTDEAARLVAAVVDLDDEPGDEELLRQLASSLPPGADDASLVRRGVHRSRRPGHHLSCRGARGQGCAGRPPTASTAQPASRPAVTRRWSIDGSRVGERTSVPVPLPRMHCGA